MELDFKNIDNEMKKPWMEEFREADVKPLEEGATNLMYACQQEDVSKITSILRKKPSTAKEKDRTLKTVLHYCTENVSLNCAELLLNIVPELLDMADENGYTTLHLAVIAGNIPLVNFLISRSADINKLDAERHSVIHWATVCGEVEVLETLLRCGADPCTPDVHGGYPIHYAAQMCGVASELGNDSRLGMQVLKCLLKHNVDVSVVDHDGRQPLLWAASAGSSEAVLALIKSGASIYARDKDGLTALHCAASRGHTDCLDTLITFCGADINTTDNNGCTALFYSVTLGHGEATLLLLKHGSIPDKQDHKGRTPAHCGAAKGQMETIKMLKNYGGDLWIRNARGDYPLHEAVNSGRKDLVYWLLSLKPDAVNECNKDGRHPLHIAALSNNVEMCKILLDHQALVNPIMRNLKGETMTPLDAALHRGNRGCAKYLQLHGGVSTNKLNEYYSTLRGPRKMEPHSDHHMTPESLENVDELRGCRSLNPSPTPRYVSSRKVQVHIQADLRSERTWDKKCTITRNEECYVKKETTRRTVDRKKKTYDYKGHKIRRKINRSRSKKNFGILTSYSDTSDTEYFESDENCRKKQKQKKQPKNDFRMENERRSSSSENEGDQRQEKKSQNQFKDSNIQTVTALVHREEEDEAKSENSNGPEDIGYQKLEAEDTEPDTTMKNKDTPSNISNENMNDPFSPAISELKNIDMFGEKPFDATVKEEITDEKCTKNESSMSIQHPITVASEKNVEVSSDNEKDDFKCIDVNDCNKVINDQDNERQAAHKDQVEQDKDEKCSADEKSIETENNIVLEDNKREDNSSRKIRFTSEEEFKQKAVSGDSEGKTDTDIKLDEKYDEIENYDRKLSKDNKGLVCVLSDNENTGKAEYCEKEIKQRRRSRGSFQVLPDDGSSLVAFNQDFGSELTTSTHHDSHPSCTTSASDGIRRSRSRIPRAKNRVVSRSEGPDINTTSVTRLVQASVRKYHLERRIFHTLLELKKSQIRAGKSSEQVLVKRLVDDYQKAGIIPGLQQYDGSYSFKHFERYLYDQLRLLQTSSRQTIPRVKSTDDFERLTKALRSTRAGKTLLEDVPDNPLFCTHGTHRCIHATHAYTGIPCAAYITKLNHHQLPKKSVDEYRCFLPRIDVKQTARGDIAKSLRNVDPLKPVTLQLTHGTEKQIISLPTEKLDKNKRYYVTFTIKGNGAEEGIQNSTISSNQRYSKSF